MKKMYTKKFSGRFSPFLLTGLVAGCLSFGNVSFAQKYYTKFPDPATRTYVINATGINCTAPPVVNPAGFADTAEATYTSFTTTRTDSFTCDPYHFVANLNLPADTPLLGAGYKAGFRIRLSSPVSFDTLRKYTVVSTYNSDGGLLIESAHTESISGMDSSGTGTDWFLYFTSTKPFNTLELNVYPNVTPLGSAFEFDVLYGFATINSSVLPATIGDFKATVAGKNVSLSFQSLTESSVASYRIERSGNGGVSYATVASLPAKGNSNAAVLYNFTDAVTVDGSYLYRVVIVNKDGTTKATNSLSVLINAQGKIFLYPSIVSAGQNINIKTSQTGAVTVLLYDAQGRAVQQQRITSTGQFTLATNGLSRGIYTVKIISATGNVLQSKIIVN